MSTSRPITKLLALVLCGMAGAATIEGQRIEIGTAENRVDVPTPFRIREPAVATLEGSHPLVVWTNDRLGILGRFLDAPQLGELTLVANSEFPSNPGRGEVVIRHNPSLLALPGGDFLLLWTEEQALMRASIFYYEVETHDRDIYAQRFSSAGAPVSERFQVNDPRDSSLEGYPRAVALEGERIAVAWETEHAVYARTIDLAAGTQGPQKRISQTRTSSSPRPALARDSSGVVALTWTGRDGSGSGIFARLFDDDLQPLSDELVVNSETHSNQKLPSITAGRTGGFLIAWHGRTATPMEYRIFTRLLGADGVPAGIERLVSGDYGQADSAAEVVTCLDGSYLVLWLNWIRPFVSFLGGIELNASGEPVSDIFQVNSERPQQQWHIDAAVAADGAIFVTWEGFPDHSQLGVSSRRLEGPQALRALRAAN